ncbi:hypothetical protein ACK32R_23725 [Aeromonas dhakensis]|uniref:hypothetical protein n=1 Tax=Aeromonas dhakensis TaxID=196024 RepID=UPI0039882234
MNQKVNIAYHEVDLLLPAHRFDIRFSYVTKKGLSFVREFVLRLVHISPMKPVDIATYFGLSRREVDEAVIPPFFGALKSRGHAACAKRCFGV